MTGESGKIIILSEKRKDENVHPVIHVELRSKGPNRKGNPHLRDISIPGKNVSGISRLAIREFQSMGKIPLHRSLTLLLFLESGQLQLQLQLHATRSNSSTGGNSRQQR